ncbi:MAG: ABC transporter ATP-binding protein, partial [Bacilli bacterium]
MFKLIRYLKPYITSVLFIISLLVVQAVCDLSLPDYMSNIVNVGIQQNGIDEQTPTVIREKELQQIQLFMDEKERNTVTNAYETVSKTDENIEKYPLLEKEALLMLKETNEKEQTTLDGIFSNALLIDTFIKEKGVPGLPEGVEISQLPESDRMQLVSEMKKNTSELTDSVKKQMNVMVVQQEYDAIGIDTSTLQRNYIFMEGAKMLGIAL